MTREEEERQTILPVPVHRQRLPLRHHGVALTDLHDDTVTVVLEIVAGEIPDVVLLHLAGEPAREDRRVDPALKDRMQIDQRDVLVRIDVRERLERCDPGMPFRCNRLDADLSEIEKGVADIVREFLAFQQDPRGGIGVSRRLGRDRRRQRTGTERGGPSLPEVRYASLLQTRQCSGDLFGLRQEREGLLEL